MRRVGDFAKLNPFVMSTWTNDRMLAINQDESGIAAVRIDGGKGLLSAVAEERAQAATGAQMAVAECGGEPANQKWTVGSDGRISNPATKTCLDVATCQTWITYGSCNATTGGCGGATDANQKWTLTASAQLQTQLASSKTKCATLQKDKTVILAACQTPVPATQKWKYDKTTQELTTGDGMCVTSLTGGSKIKAETMVLGRPLSSPPPGLTSDQLSGKSFAIFMLNNKQSAAQIVCNATCLGNLGAGSGSFTVTDVITGAPHSTAQLEAGGSVAATVPGYGASAYLRLDPK